MKTLPHYDSIIDAQHSGLVRAWLCELRKTAPANAGIRERHRWPSYRETFLRQLQ
ncbi:hypothetical protein ACSBQN_00220 [Morganella sp. B601]|uniref:hypothetical protein n=1 Tax=Morganella sp. B601 TaxID=3444315 RepID=UPI003EB87855